LVIHKWLTQFKDKIEEELQSQITAQAPNAVWRHSLARSLDESMANRVRANSHSHTHSM